MINDRVRTGTYLRAIEELAPEIKGKVCMDVGCGTGILSFFLIQNGAAKVYAVEASDLADKTKEVAEKNGWGDRVIVLHSKVEDVQLPEKVDVIVSEWMGYALLYETMFDSVLVARDRWLKPDGIMLPSQAQIMFCPFSAEELYNERVSFWQRVYNIDMSPLVTLAQEQLAHEPLVEVLAPDTMMANPIPLARFDCRTISIPELRQWSRTFDFRSWLTSELSGFVVWFDVFFTSPQHRAAGRAPICLSTAPDKQPTHWQQTLLFFPEPVGVCQDDHLRGTLTLRTAPTPATRGVEFDVSIEVPGGIQASIRRMLGIPAENEGEVKDEGQGTRQGPEPPTPSQLQTKKPSLQRPLGPPPPLTGPPQLVTRKYLMK